MPEERRTTNRVTLWLTMPVWAVALCGCRNGDGGQHVMRNDSPSPQVSQPLPDQGSDSPATAPPPRGPRSGESDWIVVEALDDDVEGGWATGSFDPDRNKLTLETEGVRGFSVDTSRIAIDWRRPVVLRLNGANSELRPRDHPVLRFHRDEHGAWIVDE